MEHLSKHRSSWSFFFKLNGVTSEEQIVARKSKELPKKSATDFVKNLLLDFQAKIETPSSQIEELDLVLDLHLDSILDLI